MSEVDSRNIAASGSVFLGAGSVILSTTHPGGLSLWHDGLYLTCSGSPWMITVYARLASVSSQISRVFHGHRKDHLRLYLTRGSWS